MKKLILALSALLCIQSCWILCPAQVKPVASKNAYHDTIDAYSGGNTTVKDTLKAMKPIIPYANHQGEIGTSLSSWLRAYLDTAYITVPKGGLKDTIDTKKRKDDSTANTGWTPLWKNNGKARLIWQNVLDYGAVGDSTTNESTAIQNAINAGNTTYFPGGKNYKINATVIIPSNHTIIIDPTAYIFAATNLNAVMFRNVDTVNGNTNIIIDGGILDGNRAHQSLSPGQGNQTVIWFFSVTNSKIKNMQLKSGNCVAWKTSTFRGVTSYNNVGNIQLDSCSNVDILNVKSTDSRNAGLESWSGYHLRIIGGDYSKNTVTGIDLTLSPYSIVGNVNADSNASSGVSISSQYAVIFGSSAQGNHQGFNLGHDSVIYSASYSTIIGCTATKNVIGIQYQGDSTHGIQMLANSSFANITHDIYSITDNNLAPLTSYDSLVVAKGASFGDVTHPASVVMYGHNLLTLQTQGDIGVWGVCGGNRLYLTSDASNNGIVRGGYAGNGGVIAQTNPGAGWVSFMTATNAGDVSFIRKVTLDSLKLNNITSGYLPYHDGFKLVNSPLRTDGTSIGLGTGVPTAALDIVRDNNPFYMRAATATAYLQNVIKNGTGELRFGVEGSGAGTLQTGDIAYASQLYTANTTALQLGVNQTVAMTLVNGGNIGIGYSTPTTTRFGVKNGLYANATTWYNSRGTLIAGIDSVGGITATTATIGGGTPIKNVFSNSLVYNCGSIAAGVDSTFSIVCTGAVAGNPVSVGVSVAAEAGLIITAECTTNDAVTVRISNHFLVSAVDPASRTFRVMVTNF